ncbi:MAG: hypothetical protein H6Q99_1822 [Proteobacteria bacterium]|nr:hypothetical protein [Pseudomonadota bacterium]
MPEATSSGVQGSLDCPPIVIVSSTEKTFLLLIVCAVFVCIGAFMIANGPATPREYIGAYVGTFFFGGGAFLVVLRLAAPPRLSLSPEGLALFNGFKTRHYAWSDFSQFVICRSSARTNVEYVGFIFELQHGEERGITKRLTGIDGGFGGAWSVSPSTLVDLLNGAKDKWGLDARDAETEAREDGMPTAPCVSEFRR